MQKSISLSTVEAKYIAFVTCCTHILLMKKNLQDIKVMYDGPILIFCDNTSVISMSKYLPFKNQAYTHKLPFFIEQFVDQIVRLEHISTKEQVVDIFTKPLAQEPFKYLRQKFGVVSPSSIKQFPSQGTKATIQFSPRQLYTKRSKSREANKLRGRYQIKRCSMCLSGVIFSSSHFNWIFIFTKGDNLDLGTTISVHSSVVLQQHNKLISEGRMSRLCHLSSKNPFPMMSKGESEQPLEMKCENMNQAMKMESEHT